MSLKQNNRIWIDENGTKHLCPPHGKKIRSYKVKEHARLREYVFKRDNFTCQICGAVPVSVPIHFDATKDCLVVYELSSWGKAFFFHLDHITPRKKGGGNHPSNLQMLCDSCNSKKRDRVCEAKHAVV